MNPLRKEKATVTAALQFKPDDRSMLALTSDDWP
jgi:hypothetical protein